MSYTMHSVQKYQNITFHEKSNNYDDVFAICCFYKV